MQTPCSKDECAALAHHHACLSFQPCPPASKALLTPLRMPLQTKVASKARHPHWGETFKLPIMVRSPSQSFGPLCALVGQHYNAGSRGCRCCGADHTVLDADCGHAMPQL